MAVKISVEDNFQELEDKVSQLKEIGEKIINEVFWNEGAELITKEIDKLLPVSGRKWKGKKAAAKGKLPFQKITSNLSVTIHSKKAYNYLYFPDDGSNTVKHAGNQQFMLRGAQYASGDIVDLCIEKLVEAIENG